MYFKERELVIDGSLKKRYVEEKILLKKGILKEKVIKRKGTLKNFKEKAL